MCAVKRIKLIANSVSWSSGQSEQLTLTRKRRGTRACSKIDHSILLNILREKFHDNRFVRLIERLLKAGYLEDWKYNQTYSGVPQGSIVSPILSNLVLDRLDRYVEDELIPQYTLGKRRRTTPSQGLTRVGFLQSTKN